MKAPNTIQIIQDEIATSARTARDELYLTLENLGIRPEANGTLSTFAADAGALLVAEPLIVPAIRRSHDNG